MTLAFPTVQSSRTQPLVYRVHDYEPRTIQRALTKTGGMESMDIRGRVRQSLVPLDVKFQRFGKHASLDTD